MIIMHNMPALRTANILQRSNKEHQHSLEKLASGMRINRGADDAAGLAISEKMRGQIRGLNQAERNTEDGISLLQTAEGGLNEIHDVLQRMHELSVQGASDTNTAGDRVQLQKEVDQLRQEVDRIRNTTQFNKSNLLDGSVSALASSDLLTTDVFLRDGLTTRDEFGQKTTVSGNYRLQIEAEAGQGQVLKTNSFRVKHGDDAGKGAGEASKLYDIEQFWDKSGNFILEQPQTLSLLQGDGKRTTFTLYGSDTIADLRDKIGNAIASGLGQVSGVTDFKYDPTQLPLSNVSAFSTGASAGRLPGAALPPTLASKFCSFVRSADPAWSSLNNIEKIVYGLQHGWLEMAEKRINTYYGLQGNGSDLTVKIYDNAAAGVLALIQTSVNPADHTAAGGRGSNHTLYIDAADFLPGVMPDGSNGNGLNFLNDRVIAHEMTHAIMSLNMNWNDVPTWFKEGSAELLHGRNDQLKIDITASGVPAITAAATTWPVGAPGSNANYSGSYAAVRYLATHLSGGKTMSDVMNSLKTNTLDTAISANSGYASAAAFLADFQGVNGQTWLQNLYDNGDLDGPDTGAIGGSGVSGGPTADPSSVIDEAGATNSGTQPLSHWTVVWPTDTSTYAANPSFDPLAAAYSTGTTVAAGASQLEAMPGTLVIRSAVAGQSGELSFAGNEAILNALGLSTVQSSVENDFSVSVYDAHSNELTQTKTCSGNLLEGAISENVAVRFAAMSGVEVTWDDANGQFLMTGGSANTDTTYVHLAARGMTFHLGANQQQDLTTGFADMGSKALGIDSVLLLSNDLANLSLGKIDRAIARVSGERAKIGAMQNRLEHTRSNLSTSSENLTAAESAIRDSDQAKEYGRSVRASILSQAATSLLAQANQLPQAALQLLR